jgi:aminoglycoside phosphotransferase family enzyme/predicted kinase
LLGDRAIEVKTLIEALSRPEAYAHSAEAIEVHQTHISVVFLAGPFAYKLKKPVNLGFLDFSTLDKRKHYCEEEVRLNRRLAPQVYLGVVPIASEPEAHARDEGGGMSDEGRRVNNCINDLYPSPLIPHPSSLRFGGSGPVVEWAVQMKRLPSAATLENRLLRDEVNASQIRVLAERIAAFHRAAQSNERISSFGRFAAVAHNARENFKQAEPLLGATVSLVVFERVRALTEVHLARHHDLIESRAEHGVPRDTHGDLHLDHVYLFPDQAPPNDLLMIDCIEFADRFRFADPVADMAFLTMDLAFHGRRDLARIFTEAYFQTSGDAEGRSLAPFYCAYRSVVRAKVEGMELCAKEIDAEERRQAERRARAHWLLALGELQEPAKRPALLLVGGLPGSGKSTLARSLAQAASFSVLRSDVIRKELAGVAESSAEAPRSHAPAWERSVPTPERGNEGIYTEAWTERTYAELLQRGERLLWLGGRVLIDANFRADWQRQAFFDAARRWGVPVLFIHCHAAQEVTRTRLQSRWHDASDADWRIYERLDQTWQPVRPEWRRLTYVLDTSGPLQDYETQLQTILRQEGLM